MAIRTYSELITFPTFMERFQYLKLNGVVGDETFGNERYLNQVLYHSSEWKKARREAIIRDNGCDLAVNGYTIYGKVYVHHMNPITIDDIVNRNPAVFDPENLITISFNTHQAVTYGADDILMLDAPIRRPNDTCPWRN